MTLVRWMFGLPVAAAVVMVLLLIMSGLIRQEFVPTEAPPIGKLSITPQIIETLPTPQPKIKPIPKDPPPPVDYTWSEKPEGIDSVPALRPGGKGVDEIDIPLAGNVKPLIRVAPRYPQACAAKGVEGVVLVEFDVTAEGNVVNPRVISSSNSCFDRAAVKAVSGWKYPPDMRDGRPVPRYGVTERFNFQLTD